MDELSKIERALSGASHTLDSVASSIGKSGVVNSAADIEELGKAIASISEVLVSVYETRPDLAPDWYKEPSSQARLNRTFARILLQNEMLLAKNQPDSAIEGLQKFLSDKPPIHYQELATNEIQRIKNLFGPGVA